MILYFGLGVWKLVYDIVMMCVIFVGVRFGLVLRVWCVVLMNSWDVFCV